MKHAWIRSGVCPLLIAAAFAGCSSNTQDATAIERGEALYADLRCGRCHGADALGQSTFPAGPRILGRSADDIALQLRGMCELPLDTSCHPLKVETLSDSDVDALAAFLGSLPDSNSDPQTRDDTAMGVTIRPVCNDTPGVICTVAGSGASGNIPGTQLARTQSLFWPQNVTLDPEGRVVITDWNNYLIRRLEAPDSPACQAIVDPAGSIGTDCPLVNIVGTGDLGDSCSTATDPIAASASSGGQYSGVLYDDLIPGQQNLMLWGWHTWKIKYVPVLSDGSTGNIDCVWGNVRGTGPEDVPAGFDRNQGITRFNLPAALVYDDAKNFYISDQGNLRIRIIRADADDDFSSPETLVASLANNLVTTFAGGLLDDTGFFRRTLPDYSDSGDGGPAGLATFKVQAGFDAVVQFRLAIDRPSNQLYVADSENHRIRVIDLTTGMIDTFAGGGDDVNGPTAESVRLRGPADVDVSPDGTRVLITDTLNHCMRVVEVATRSVTTVAGVCGEGTFGDFGDGGPGTRAMLYEPGGGYLADDGSVYIADTLNHRVRRVNPL